MRLDSIQSKSLQYDTIRYDMSRSILGIRYDTTGLRCDSTGLDVIRYATMRYDTTRYAALRYDTMVRETTRRRYEHDTITARCDTIR